MTTCPKCHCEMYLELDKDYKGDEIAIWVCYQTISCGYREEV